ncbi:hypothetical protein VNO77_18341 [Canavalia gladiata]|uniref:Uncharacterized protein n=1 Tax=Canavalia gladiata TaxID=3824 RepID=A0AAN9LKM4_CANGL
MDNFPIRGIRPTYIRVLVTFALNGLSQTSIFSYVKTHRSSIFSYVKLTCMASGTPRESLMALLGYRSQFVKEDPKHFVGPTERAATIAIYLARVPWGPLATSSASPIQMNLDQRPRLALCLFFHTEAGFIMNTTIDRKQGIPQDPLLESTLATNVIVQEAELLNPVPNGFTASSYNPNTCELMLSYSIKTDYGFKRI